MSRSSTIKWALDLATRFSAPKLIPMSDRAKARKRNYCVAYLRNDGRQGRYNVDYVTLRGVRASYWLPNDEVGAEVALLDCELPKLDLIIVQYLAELEIRYDSAAEFVFHQMTGFAYLLLWRDRLKSLLVRRSRMVRADRIKVLRTYLSATLKKADFRASVVGLMQELHGPRVFDDHPQLNELEKYYQLILQSLQQSSDLTGVQGEYSIAPGAMKRSRTTNLRSDVTDKCASGRRYLRS